MKSPGFEAKPPSSWVGHRKSRVRQSMVKPRGSHKKGISEAQRGLVLVERRILNDHEMESRVKANRGDYESVRTLLTGLGPFELHL